MRVIQEMILRRKKQAGSTKFSSETDALEKLTPPAFKVLELGTYY